MRSSKFQGAYVEMGYLLCGEGYGYDDEYGLLRGSNERGDLEIVARYSYTDLNDINKGDFFLIGKQVFYPGGVVADYPAVSTSIGGGRLHAATIGVNYTFNQYVKVMGEYQYSNLKNVYFPSVADALDGVVLIEGGKFIKLVRFINLTSFMNLVDYVDFF